MAKSFSSLAFDGQMRVDANHAGNPDYAPNSFEDPTKRFRAENAETPYAVADSVVSRKSHYYHEGKLSEYDQPRELYERVMTATARDHLHSNTAVMLAHVSEKDIQVRYLAQQYRISTTLARAIYDLLPDKHKQRFGFDEVEKMAEGAEKMTKTPRFLPSQNTDKLVGKPVQGIYNT